MNTIGLIIELIRVMIIVIQITISIGYLSRNMDIKYMQSAGMQQSMLEPVRTNSWISSDKLDILPDICKCKSSSDLFNSLK